MKTTLNQDIDAVIRLLRRGWCQGPLAKDKRGRPVEHDDPKACRWCAIGAVWKVAGNTLGRRVDRIENAFYAKNNNFPVIFNENYASSKLEVIAAFLACKTKPRTKRIKH